MKTKFVLLSNLLALLWACTMPATGQTSFISGVQGKGDDRPSGMLQQKNGSYVCYGTSGSWSPTSGQNYIAGFDSLGKFIWQQSYNNLSQGDWLTDMIELPDGNLLAGGYAQWQLQGLNPRLTLLNSIGEILRDTVYSVSNGTGSIDNMHYDAESSSIVSVGISNVNSLYFQVTTSNLKVLAAHQVPIQESYRFKKFFPAKGKSGYVLFGEHSIIRLDNNGYQIGYEYLAVDSFSNQSITDVISLDTGGFLAIVCENYQTSWLQYFDGNGERLPHKVKIPIPSFEGGGYIALNKTNTGGLVLLGSDLLVLSNRLKEVRRVKFWSGEDYGWRSVAQASDGGYYGCALDGRKQTIMDYDIFVFKTLPDGTVRTGITEQVTEQDMQIYPNPATHTLHLPQQVNIEQVKLCDITGRVVLQQATVVGHTLDVSSLQPGYYLLQLTTNKGTYAQRVYITR